MIQSVDKRERLVAAASELFHHQGYHQTSLADIAYRAGVPIGNVYYYFKTKEALGCAVVAQRRTSFEQLFAELGKLSDARTRLLSFLDLVDEWSGIATAHGCPVGSLCQELDKDRTELAEHADGVLQLQYDWVLAQFEQLLDDRDANSAAARAGEFLSSLQGGMVMAHAMSDQALLETQVRRLREGLIASRRD